MFEHPEAATVWETLKVEKGGDLELVLMIETKIILNQENPEFDADRYNSLTGAVAQYIGQSKHFDRAEIHPIHVQK